ncbi:MAG: hypothetical protein PUB37_01175 [Firmicutes bacterium]|nr:hypothetical protein [Bacillota bacterium]
MSAIKKCIKIRTNAVDIARNSDRHRTSVSRFLRSEQPVPCIIDDTISSKTVPSSKSNHPIEGAYFHFSHLKKKQDYGHQAVSVMLSCNGITLNYAIIMYDKSLSKIDIVKQIAQELPTALNPSYLLCDSWYVCGK